MKSRLFSRHFLGLIVSLIGFLILRPAALAQSDAEQPNVQVSEQGIVDGRVNIVRAVVDGPAWVVIHADADGKPGPVIGHAALHEGENTDVVVEIDTAAATPLLHAMLHTDAGVVGTFEFPGPDAPIKIGDNIVMALFSAAPPAPPTPTAREETVAEAASGAAAPTAGPEETATPEKEVTAEAEATPTAAPEEGSAWAETGATPTAVPEEESTAAESMAVAVPTAAPAQEAETDTGAPEAGSKGAAPTSMPVTGAGASLPLILGAVGVVLAALGGSVAFGRRRSG